MENEEKRHELTNRDISEQYRDYKTYLMLSDFQGAFAHCVTKQNPNGTFVVDKPLEAYTKYLQLKYFKTKGKVVEFNYDNLRQLINEDVFKKDL